MHPSAADFLLEYRRGRKKIDHVANLRDSAKSVRGYSTAICSCLVEVAKSWTFAKPRPSTQGGRLVIGNSISVVLNQQIHSVLAKATNYDDHCLETLT